MSVDLATPAPAPAAPAAGSSRRLVTVAVLLALVVAAFEGTVVTGAMPTIVAELGGLEIYSWVFSAFLVASMIGILACGKLADAYGRRPVFIAGMGLFLAGSALSGAARSIDALIAFRVIQGLGAGAIQPIAMTISADLYTLRERVRVQTLFTAAWGSANALGPLIGGWIVIHASWRWVFLVNVPVGVRSPWCCCWPRTAIRRGGRAARWARVGWRSPGWRRRWRSSRSSPRRAFGDWARAWARARPRSQSRSGGSGGSSAGPRRPSSLDRSSPIRWCGRA